MWSVGQRINIEFLENQEFIVVKHMEGGMGDVYKVVDPTLVNYFSIKTLKQSMGASDFKKECEIFVTASRHDSCVKPVGYGLIESHPAIAYHWYTSTLADHNSKNWKIEEIENILSKLMSFFHYVSDEIKILHCDIKPSNILLDEMRNPYVTDFGISKIMDKSESLKALKAAAGTREYMAPELIFTNKQNVKSELYSFGITIYEFLTGCHPYINDRSPDKNLKEITKNFKILRKKLGKNMKRYLDYIERCMSIESAKRPDSFKLNEPSNAFNEFQRNTDNRAVIDSISMQATYYRKENDFVMSEQILHDAITLHGRDPVLLNGLGNTYSCSRSREESIKPLEEASEIIFRSDGIWDSLLYIDPIINLSIQYRCVGRYHDSFLLLKRAWEIFKYHENQRFLYSEFGWMMIYQGDFLASCNYLDKCFLNRCIQPFEMACFTEAAWICGKIKDYADRILSNVTYNDQFSGSYYFCAFLLSKYSSRQATDRMMKDIDENTINEIASLENENGLPEFGLRPPLDASIEAVMVLGIDHLVTGGKYEAKIFSRDINI
jgi:serine/threonine protein kinase